MYHGATTDAERSTNSSTTPLTQAAADDVERVGAGEDVEQDACPDENPKIFNTEHRYQNVSEGGIRFEGKTAALDLAVNFLEGLAHLL